MKTNIPENESQYRKEFFENLDDETFTERFKARSELFNRDSLSYSEIMIGCYDVFEHPFHKLDWGMARERFMELVKSGVFEEVENEKFKLL